MEKQQSVGVYSKHKIQGMDFGQGQSQTRHHIQGTIQDNMLDENLISNMMNQLMEKVMRQRNDVVEKIVKQYISDHYGKEMWPQLMGCVGQEVDSSGGTIYNFNQYKQIKGNIVIKKIPLVRFDRIMNNEVPTNIGPSITYEEIVIPLYCGKD